MASLVSIVLPVHNQADHLRMVVEEYEQALSRVPTKHELLLVPNACTDASPAICLELSEKFKSIRVVESEKGWGKAVRTGLAASRGDILCYTNLARTASQDLVLSVLYGLANPGTVIKANRKIRDNWRRRLGSLLYNLECRMLFDLSYWDINGTPKVFERSHAPLLELKRDDDLIDLEFNVICREQGIPMLEVPILSTRRHGGRSTTRLRSALKLYVGAWRMARARRKGRA